MAIRDWHGGQLAVFCVGMAWGDFVIMGLFNSLNVRNLLATAVAYTLIMLVIPGVILGVAWEWFGSRRDSAS